MKSLDGGLHNYTFSVENGAINQSAWSALSEGSFTITFYASDIACNEAVEHVVVTKSLTTVIITIIVVSIVSGVALIGVGYIYFKKRKNRISE